MWPWWGAMSKWSASTRSLICLRIELAMKFNITGRKKMKIHHEFLIDGYMPNDQLKVRSARDIKAIVKYASNLNGI